MLSVVVPVFNEAQSLETLCRELREVAAAEGYELDAILVDDGSTDQSWDVISRLAAADPQVRGIRFRRNFGKTAALSAGVAEARGELVMTLDADLQDDPHEIPHFLAEMASGYDVVSGWKRVRHDPWEKVFPSRVFNRMVSLLTGVQLHDHNCGMKCYRRPVFDEVRIYGELHRFIPVLAAARGYRVGEVVVNHRPRRFGRSKYGLARFVKGFLDLFTVKFLTSFGQRPQHVLGTAGLIALAFGLLGLADLSAAWVVDHAFPGASWLIPHGQLVVLGSIASLLLGGQLLSTGLVAELLVAQQGSRTADYGVAARAGGTDRAAGKDQPNTGRLV
jgi:dolichol-phosphate mannosyltransferase